MELTKYLRVWAQVEGKLRPHPGFKQNLKNEQWAINHVAGIIDELMGKNVL